MSDCWNQGNLEEDCFPREVRELLDDPDIQDGINRVQEIDLHSNVETAETEESVGMHPENAAISLDLVPQAPRPSATSIMLSTEVYPGPYSFEMKLIEKDSDKNWQFHHDKNILYIKLDTTINLFFKCNSYPIGHFVRAVGVYCGSGNFQSPVERCPNHKSAEVKPDVPDDIVDHVIRIVHPDSKYEYDENSRRRSVRLQLYSPQAGSDWVTIPLKFMCYNSCPGGMNKRETEVIFTLEDTRGGVHGRQKMRVKTCCWPKRDIMFENPELKERDSEIISHGKRLMHPKKDGGFHLAKKRKPEQQYQIPVLDLEAYRDGTNYLYEKLKKKVESENRSPTKDEKKLLRKYEEELKRTAPRMKK